MSSESRALTLDIEVPGSPEEVWRAVATGPGISSWWVPHTVEERSGGVATASFGPEPEMQISGRVAVWDPPHRVVFDGGEGVDGMSFLWTVEAVDDDTCRVRLVNSGFDAGPEGDALYEAMRVGWSLFLCNLRLHLTHFAGQSAIAVLPRSDWAGPWDAAWRALKDALELSGPRVLAIGEKIAVTAPCAPPLAGTIGGFYRSLPPPASDPATGEAGARTRRMLPRWLALVIDKPAPGTAFLTVEGDGEQVNVSVWLYLYGPEGAVAAEREGPRWQTWLNDHATTPATANAAG